MNLTKHATLLATLSLSLLLTACNAGRNSDNEATLQCVAIDSTHIEHIYRTPADSTRLCRVTVDLAYPTAAANEEQLSMLNCLLAACFFDEAVAAYTSLTELMDTLASARLEEMKLSMMELDTAGLLREETEFTTVIKVTPVYNRNNLLVYDYYNYTYEGGAHGIYNNNYYVIYLPTMARLTLIDIIEPEYYEALNEALVETLMKQLGITDSEQLVDAGYFDPDGITATDNFYVDDKGITWVYNLYEIGCYALGPTCITLPYDEVEYFMNDNCPLRNIFNK